MEHPVAPFRVGTWLVQPRRNRITRNDQTIALEPKVMEVLVVLAEQAGEVVTRDELLEAIWAELVVTEEALTRCISALRIAFGDDYQHPTFIETIRKTGYRLIAPVTLADPVPLPLGTEVLCILLARVVDHPPLAVDCRADGHHQPGPARDVCLARRCSEAV